MFATQNGGLFLTIRHTAKPEYRRHILKKNGGYLCVSHTVVECWFNKICLLKDNALLEIGNNPWDN